MQNLRTYLIGCLVALILLGQGLGQAHASVHGDHPHEHNGVVCDVTLISEDLDDLILPPSPKLPADPIAHARQTDAPALTFALPTPHSRAPPPRAPPSYN